MNDMTISSSENWFGPEYCPYGWAPAPRYLLRRARVLNYLKKASPDDLIEIGSASGALLSELSSYGFRCTGLEASDQAFSLARKIHKDSEVKFQQQPDSTWFECFQYCLSFEVLEHIEDDHGALKQWADWLKPGGKMILSVPAHPRLWNGRDVWAGHYRRYRRKDLEAAFKEAGLNIQKIECYGFPMANMLEFIAANRYKKYLGQDETKQEKIANTATSGVDRSLDVKIFPYYAKFPGSWLMRIMILVQNLFVNLSIGNGFLVIAEKPDFARS